jgi:DNA-binding NtrC family response regulator
MSRAVLVVDDDRNIVRTLCDLLRRSGWTPHGVHSGEEAVAAAADGRYGAVVMDVRMAGIDGVAAFRAIRERQPRVPVVLMTAYSTRELLAEAERLGVLRILPKPLPLRQLLALLDDAVRQGEGVLLVDDDPNFLQSLSAVLAAAGHRPLAAATLEQALSRLHDDDPAVVVLDLKLDDVEPYDAVDAIRRESSTVSLILCSGYPELVKEILERFPEGYFEAVLTKPCDPARLLAILGPQPRAN